jgi:hypothetical protein
MLLPFSRDYKSTMLTGKVNGAQVAVPNPQTGEGYRDQLTYRTPASTRTANPATTLSTTLATGASTAAQAKSSRQASCSPAVCVLLRFAAVRSNQVPFA